MKPFSKNFFYMDTLETAEENVVLMPGLVWHCRFTHWRCNNTTLGVTCLKKQQQLAENISVA